MIARGRLGAVLLSAALVLAGCGGSSEELADEPEPSQETPSEEATAADETPTAVESATTEPTEAATPAQQVVVIEEDFTQGPGTFAAGEVKNYSVTHVEKALELFVRGLGASNSVYTPAALPTPASTVSIEALAQFQIAAGEGTGGYGLRCEAGDDHYLLFWGQSSGIDTPDRTSIAKFSGGSFEIVEEQLQPDGVAVGDNGLEMTALCQTTAAGAAEVSLSIGGTEVVSYTDEEPLGPFDVVSLYGEWNGERIPPNDFNPVGGGLTFRFDNVLVSTAE